MFESCHQVIGVFADRDAVGGHTVEVRRACRSLGLRSEIYALSVADGTQTDVRSVDDLPPDDGRTLLLYQASALSPVADVVATRREPLVVNYHNVTLPSFFEWWEPAIAQELLDARRQIASLASRAAAGIADSQYNAAELARMGCADVHVVPVLIDLDRVRAAAPDDRAPAGVGTRWLFVGRLCPNKAQHDVIKAFALHRRLFDPAATLALVGRSSSHRYETALRALVDDLDVGDAVRLVGSVDDDTLAAAYRTADVFVCLSEHEGFCNTVVEAMAARVPVVAYASSALPETLGGGGLLLPDKDPLLVATAVQRVMSDRDLHDRVVRAGTRRLAALDLDAARAELGRVLSRLVAA